MREQRAPSPGMKRVAAALLALQLVAESAAPAYAQRRRAEPEANPDFQNQMQAPTGTGGGPLGDAEPDAGGPPPAAEPARDRSVQGVQIGASPAARPAAPAISSPLETRVTVRVKGAPLATFLDTISAQAKVNFIITEGLEQKRVTAFLQNVTVREALQVLLEIKGLSYQQIGKSNTYVVTPRSKQAENYITRIYTLNYIPLIPLDAAGGGAGASAAAAAAAGAGNIAGQTQAPASHGAGGEDGGISIISVLKSVLTKPKGGGPEGGGGGSGGQIAIEPRTNSLIVTDIPEIFPQVEQIIAELDKKAPQVMIETQIVEIDSNRARDLGFEWGGTNGELGRFVAGARDTRFPMDLPSNLSKVRFFDPVNNVVSGLGESKASDTGGDSNAAATALGSNLLTSVVDLTSLKVTLRALVSRSEARFLGKPKIMTLNNKSAIIQVSAREAVGFRITQAGTTGGSSTQANEPERVDTGLILRVTPQVNKEGYITMLVQPSFTDVKQSNVSTINTPVFDPISRAASTLVRVRNAQTLVLGGLLRSTETKTIRKVPLLGYIPLLGWFFTSSSMRRQNSDLVIFITPTIVND